MSQDDYNFLYEATFDISKDTELLYSLFLKKFVGTIEEIPLIDVSWEKLFSLWLKNLKSLNSNELNLVMYETNSGILNDADCKQSHKLNPINIYFGLSKNGSYYNSIDHYIMISLNIQVIESIVKYGYNNLINNQSKKINSKLLKNEFTKNKFNSMISHELCHWCDDSIHNFHILNKSILSKELKNIDIMKLNQKDVNMTYFEIDAQIHGIKMLKKLNEDLWNK